MPDRRLGSFLRFLHRTVGPPHVGELTDGQLLERFLSGQDSSAFEALMQRHGSVVWGVCRRVAYEPQDAEDAFQATFLVLLRKANSLIGRASVASWLYGVAYRVTLNANTAALRRRRRERKGAPMAEQAAPRDDRWDELRPVLDAELSRLPEDCRAALVLCYLEGKTNETAARELGWAAGSISKKLARGRELLRDRLAARGVALSAVALGTLLTQNAASAAPPAAVAQATAEIALLAAAGKGTTAGLASAQVSHLTEGVLRTMFLAKCKIIALSVAAFAGAAVSFTVLRAQPAAPAAPTAAALEAQAVQTTKLDLTPESFAKLHALVRPQPSEWRHLQVQWLTDVVAARKKAAAEDKPILICYTGGAGYNEPLGVC